MILPRLGFTSDCLTAPCSQPRAEPLLAPLLTLLFPSLYFRRVTRTTARPTHVMLRHPPPPALRSLVEVKLGGVLARRVRRIATLESAVLSLRIKQAVGNEPPACSFCVLDAVIDARRHTLSIAVRVNGQRVKLYVPNERKFDTWLRSLRASSRWKVHNFYSFGEPIAAGQFATVHSASERVSADLVAVKVVRKPMASECNPRVLQFIRREAYVCRVVEHSSVARIHDVFETPDALYVVMDHFAYTLHDVISAQRVLREADAASVLKAVLNGVKYLHEHNIVHRDIKPDNILCKHDVHPYTVAICDFGLSNLTDPAAQRATLLGSNPESSRRRINDQSLSSAHLDARRFLAAANGASESRGMRRFSEDFADSPASDDDGDDVLSESGGSDDGTADPSSPLSAFREQQRANARENDQHARALSHGHGSSVVAHQSQSFSFSAFARLRMRRAPSDARAPVGGRSRGRSTGPGSYGSTVSGVSAFTSAGEPASWQTTSRGLGKLRTAERSNTNAEPPSSRRTVGQQEATAYGADATIFPSAIDGFTLTSAIGTPCYVAPEIVERERYGPPVDVWGCGLLLYLMLCGELPFKGKDSSETLEKIRECELKMEGPVWSEISFAARTLVRGMLQKDPRRRITVEQALAHNWITEAPDTPRNGSSA